jgi:hypothetical protein
MSCSLKEASERSAGKKYLKEVSERRTRKKDTLKKPLSGLFAFIING